MTIRDWRVPLRAFLLTDATLAAAKVYPLVLPQGLQTGVVYQIISNIGEYNNDGPSGLARPRIQIDYYAKTSDGAWALARAGKDLISGYSGPMGSGGSQINVQGVFLDSEGEEVDEASKLYRVRQDYFVTFEES